MSILLELDPLYQFTRSELLALEALVLTGRPGRVAFRHWADCVDFENIRAAATQLVPALFASYAHANDRLPHYPRMRGVFRLNHLRNGLSLDAAWHTAARLQEHGVEVMIFKGASLALAFYQRPALRPMGDVDIIVPAHDYERANAILQEIGWRYRYEDDARLLTEHSCDYINATGQAIDLHVRTLLEVRNPAFDDGVFRRAQSFNWRGMEVRIPSPEDEALIGMVSAMRELGAVRLLWILDLARIIAASPRFDWRGVWQNATAFGIAEPVFHALQIAGQVRGLEWLHDVLAEQIAGTPEFEREYLREAVATGSTYGLPASQRGAINRIIAQTSVTAEEVPQDQWADFTNKPGGFGSIRVLETDHGEIKALYLRWRYLPFLKNFFCISDFGSWETICGRSPSTGEGVLELIPGQIQRWSPTPAPESYQREICVFSALPAAMRQGERLRISIRVTNTSTHPWQVSAHFPFIFGLSWHVFGRDGAIIEWDHPRHFLRPAVLRERSIAFIEPGGQVDCELAFTAPTAPGQYVIQFDVVHEGVRWFADSSEMPPIWELTVTSETAISTILPEDP